MIKEALDKKAQLNAMEICCDAIMILGETDAKYARELAEKETDETRNRITSDCGKL